MSNTEFTKVFVELSGSLTNVSQVVLIGNFVINVILAGAMYVLWGLLHSLQIVSHFPLVNIMMPTNARKFFEVIIKIATFNMVPQID